MLNLKSEKGKKILHEMLKEADILLTNWRTKALVKQGLDYETLKEKYPKLVFAQITGYGEKGPDKDLPGFDYTAFSLEVVFQVLFMKKELCLQMLFQDLETIKLVCS